MTGCAGTAGPGGGNDAGPQLKTLGTLQGGVFRLEDRKAAPALSGRSLQGKPLTVTALRGKVVVLNFWASWCAPCRAEAPNLNKVQDTYRSVGVDFVGIDIKDDRAAALAFQRAKGATYPSIYDQSGSLLLEFAGQAPQSPPSTLVLDRRGRIAAAFYSAVTEAQLAGPVQVLAREQA